MLTHTSSPLQGPVTRERSWWTTADDAPIRTELVERVRREIAEGTYDTPEKWDIALDRLLNQLEP